MTIATDGGGHRRTPTDDLSQARDAAALAVRACNWLRDEQASGPARVAQASGRPCGREVGLPAVTLTGEQIAADRNREPVSGQPDLGMCPAVEGRDRADREQDDR